MTGIIFTAEHVVAGVGPDGAATILDDAALLVEAGMIRALGRASDVRGDYPGFTVCRDYERHTLLPGLVNAHHHIGVTPVQRGMPDLPLERWVIRRAAEPAVDAYLDALYGAMDMVSSGITSVMHLHADKVAAPETLLRDARETIRAYLDVGMRVSYAIMFFDQNALGYVGPQVIDDLTPPERQAAGAIATRRADMDFAAHADVLRTLADEFAAEPRVRIQLAPANLQWCSHASLERFAELAQSAGMPVHMHLLETQDQRRYATWRTTGRGPVAYLRQLGFRGQTVTLGHGTWIASEEMEAIAEAGYSVCHNCSSNLRLSSGLAPVGAMVRAGINVALGLDEAGLNDDRDMLQEMRLAMHLSKAVDLAHQPHGLGAATVLGMASMGGAATLGWNHHLGRLAPGLAADFIAFDHRQAMAPAQVGAWSPLDILLYRGRPQHLRGVHVAGEPVVRDGAIVRVDGEACAQRIGEALARAPHADAGRLAALQRIEERVLAAHAEGRWFSR